MYTHTRWFVSEMLQVFVSGSLQTTDRPDVTVLVAKACVTPLEAAVPGADAQRLCDRGLEVRTDKPWPRSRGRFDVARQRSEHSWSTAFSKEGLVDFGLRGLILQGLGLSRSGFWGSSLLAVVGLNPLLI